MSGNVVAFARPEKSEPYLSGEAKCIDCGARWVAVAPVGVMNLECRDCGTMRGRWLYPVGAAEGDLLFSCACGNDGLVAYKRNGKFWLQCMACGVDQTEALFG